MTGNFERPGGKLCAQSDRRYDFDRRAESDQTMDQPFAFVREHGYLDGVFERPFAGDTARPRATKPVCNRAVDSQLHFDILISITPGVDIVANGELGSWRAGFSADGQF